MIPELLSGERQVADSVEGIRADHVARYIWAAGLLGGQKVVDAACGVGYGSRLLAEAGCIVRSYDRSKEAIRYAEEHYAHHEVTYRVGSLYHVSFPHDYDAVVCFEALEHIAKPERALRQFREMATRLLVSVPNESAFPFRAEMAPHHVRHYTLADLRELLLRNGWQIDEVCGQAGPESEVRPGFDSATDRTLVVSCTRLDEAVEVDEAAEQGTETERPASRVLADTFEMFRDQIEEHRLPGRELPKSVAIVAMGRTRAAYINQVVSEFGGDPHAMVDEVWAVNAMGGLLTCDRIIAMDDMSVQRARAEARPDTHVADLVRQLDKAKVPVYTSRVHEGMGEQFREYPLELVLNRCLCSWFNNTVPYAIALALALGVEEIRLFGVDYDYEDPELAAKRERGRSCVHFWLGVALFNGVAVQVQQNSTLFDGTYGGPNVLYGYDTEWVTIEMDQTSDGRPKFNLARVPRSPDDIPSPDEMELRYSHHPTTERLEAAAKENGKR